MPGNFVCHKCWIIFHNRSAMQNHARQKHQRDVKTIFKNGNVNLITRAADGLFPCPCGSQRFLLPQSLQRHAKKCDGQTAMTERMIEDGVMELSSEAEAIIESMSEEAEGDTQFLHGIN